MTASALRGDREACFEAGMDDYMSKPISLEDLRRALSRAWERRGEPLPVAVPSPADPVLDPTYLNQLRELEHRAGRELLRPVVESFLEQSPQRLEQIRAALHSQDWEGLVFAAHSLKGSSAQLGAGRLAAVLQELEAEARQERRPGEAAAVLDRVDDELRQAAVLLRTAVSEMAP
jgi:HPt (histidine-containing phosphotransfer) domain-containing protein